MPIFISIPDYDRPASAQRHGADITMGRLCSCVPKLPKQWLVRFLAASTTSQGNRQRDAVVCAVHEEERLVLACESIKGRLVIFGRSKRRHASHTGYSRIV